MRLRTRFALAIFVTGVAGMGLLVADHVVSTSRLVRTRAEARAEALGEQIASLSLPRLRSGDVEPLRETLAAFSRLPRLTLLEVRDRRDRLVHSFVSGPAAGSGRRVEWSGRVSDGREDHGTVQVALAFDGAREDLRVMTLRACALGAGGVAALAVLSWLIGARLGREMEDVAAALETFHDGAEAALPELDRRTEIGRLSRALLTLKLRLKTEERRRQDLERQREEFADTLVHDLKHPVTVLHAVLETMDAGRGASDAELLPMARRAVIRLNAMIEGLIQAARAESATAMRRRRLPVAAFLERCADENSLIVTGDGRPWRLESAAEEGLAVYGDETLLRRALGNLVLNAVEHSTEGAAVTLGARPRADGTVELYVHDSGEAIPPSRLAELAKRFATFSDSTRNVGLGLAFCKLAAERHSGRFSVTSEAGRGSTFSLLLPAMRSAAAAAAGTGGRPARDADA